MPAAVIVTLVTVIVSAAMSWGVTNYIARSAEKRVSDLERDLNAFKLDAARRFVTDEMLVQVESRIVTAIDRLADRLDRIIEGRKVGG